MQRQQQDMQESPKLNKHAATTEHTPHSSYPNGSMHRNLCKHQTAEARKHRQASVPKHHASHATVGGLDAPASSPSAPAALTRHAEMATTQFVSGREAAADELYRKQTKPWLLWPTNLEPSTGCSPDAQPKSATRVTCLSPSASP